MAICPILKNCKIEKEKSSIFRQKKIPYKGDHVRKKMASYLHRTATTTYLCCVPTLEDSAGAGRVGLAVANIQPFYIFPSVYNYYNNFCIL